MNPALWWEGGHNVKDDFNANIRGFGLTVEAKYNSYAIAGSSEAGIAVVGNLCWK